ncbi:MAG: DUF885 domain-containing protein [Myxococcota bacterium]
MRDDPHHAAAGVADPALADLLLDHWEEQMRRSPLWATSLGDRRYDGLLDATGPEAVARDRVWRAQVLSRAEAIDPARLRGEDATTWELFVGELRVARRAEVCHVEQWGLSARNNPVVTMETLPVTHAPDTPEKLETYRSRVRQLPRLFAESEANLRAGMAAGRVPNAQSVKLVIEQVDRQLAKPDAEWEVAKPGADVVALRAAIAAYRAFLRDELLPVARDEAHEGAWAVKDGDACYAALIESHTTLPLAAQTLHDTGLAEMAKIHDEFRALGEKVFGTRDLAAIFRRLREDPALHFTTRDEVRVKAEEALAAARARIPAFFGRLPKAGCEVRTIADFEAPYTTIAYYWPSVPDGSQPGFYYVNTWAPETRPRFEAEVLAFHESIPGHHLQIAIAQELPELPAFRRHGMTTAYIEGWALYTERLADEMGLYTGDLDRLGMLSFDAWRASRLVVDTGVHALRWTRGDAERWMRENTPLAENNIVNEVDRYVTWPGQALAYKTGQIEIWRLRREAEAALGPRFDLKAFHDVVLTGGPVSLPVLDRRVRAFIAAP